MSLRGPMILQFALFEVFQVSSYLASQADLHQDLEPPDSVFPAAGVIESCSRAWLLFYENNLKTLFIKCSVSHLPFFF